MFVMTMSIFWGADMRPDGGWIQSWPRVQPVRVGPNGPTRLMDHTTRGSGPPLLMAGSHKTHRHGIAVEDFATGMLSSLAPACVLPTMRQ